MEDKYNILLTAGHSLKQAGARGINGFKEEVETIKLRDDVTKHLKKWYNATVWNDNDTDSLQTVINQIKSKVKSKYDISVDIHFNAGPPSANGVEVIIPNVNSLEEKFLGTKLSAEIAKTLKLKNRGLKTEKDTAHGSIGILRQPVAATNILIEVCFITNVNDVTAYYNNYWELVKCISDTLGNYISN
jgi:N-acetylmuramoyl-L-alanine amidase